MNQLDERVRVVDWVDGLESWLLRGERCRRTVENYLADVRVFCRFYQEANGQPFEPGLLTSMDLREFRTWSVEVARVAPGTWNRRMASLEALSRFAFEGGYVNYNPFQGLTRMEEEELAPRWLEDGEYKRFMRTVERSVQAAGRSAWGKRMAIRDQAMVALMVYGGLRESEVADLQVGDVVIRERSGVVVVRKGKGDKKREVPLGNEARRALGMWLEARGDQRTGKLFVGKRGDISPRGVQKVVEQLAEESGVEVSCHQLRHTCAKRMLDRSVPLTVIQKILGHANLKTTARYVQPGAGDLQRAVENL